MQIGQVMHLHCGSIRVPVEVTESAHSESLHTRRRLRVLRAEARFHGREVADLLFPALARGPVSGDIASTGEVVRWIVSSPMHSITDERYLVKLELKEYEPVDATRLHVADFDLALLRYAEKAEDGGITIDAVVSVPKASNEAFRRLVATRDLDQYHPVKRIGISDETIRARFGGNMPWSEHEDMFKYSIVLVDERSDVHRRALDARPFDLWLESSGSAHALAYRIGQLERLAALLVEKGVLSQSELDQANAQAKEGAAVRRLNFTEVLDAERHFG